MKKKHRLGSCPKCGKVCYLSRHHIYPRRFFNTAKDNKKILLICRKCHDELELSIPKHQKLPRWQYIEIVKSFLGGRYV